MISTVNSCAVISARSLPGSGRTELCILIMKTWHLVECDHVVYARYSWKVRNVGHRSQEELLAVRAR